ncbi:double-strand break repair helicase AddA [Rhodovulum sp. DZ06]|uniref:double-strand break repair helicase AddA n=1 Tax=Rhodovulum sp. DZ06 TaxID=3425126 RepID=UPI003D33B9AA
MTDTTPEGAAAMPQMSDASRAQAQAADPVGSAWVSANAGSGKTRVLTDRVARLLLAGARPEKILCLTYTRAAAAEMQERLFALLGQWAMMDDAKLAKELQSRSETALDLSAPVLDAARRLFASALETPGGLKIQTIHAFCEKLLRRFPLEAGISPRFEVLDDRAAAQVRATIRERMAAAAEAGEDGAFDAAARRTGEYTLDKLDGAILSDRALFEGAGDAAALFDLPDAPEDQLWDEAAAALDPDGMANLAERFAALGKRARDKIPLLHEAVTAFNEMRPRDAVAAAAKALLKADGAEPYGPAWLLGKKQAEEDAVLVDMYLDAAESAAAANERVRAIETLAKARDLSAYASAFLAAYETEKEARAALDFADLVGRARALLSTSEAAAWALFKLDGGVDHILIDEAQDTAPEQWDVITAIADELTAGEGARDGAQPRTLFVVGDEKQSIYSFQGAAPEEFGARRARFAARLESAPRPLHKGELAHSFRSAPAILTLTDEVFRGRADGLSAEGRDPNHIAFHHAAPGLVELWPFLEKEPEAEEPPWDDPVDAPAPRAPKARLAEAVSEHVAALLQEGAPIPDRKNGGWRAMRPRDVMILVRSRAGLAPGLIRGLKGRGVDVAGADRMVLANELATKDLLALLKVAQDPGDDLSLAALLRSPLGGLTEDGLFALAHARPARLFDALRGTPEAAPDALAMIEEAIASADYQRPHEILSRALVDHGGRAALLARLGVESEEAIDELLTQALAYERAETPTLAGFLAWLTASDDLEVKREQGGGADEVRVMTVHGAKGLEAPFVILPDTGPRKARAAPDVIGLEAPGGGRVAAWSVKKDRRPSAMQAALEALEDRDRQERDRLLYVALTRAENRLLIAGGGDPGKDGKALDDSWWGMARAAMERLGAEQEAPPQALSQEAAPGAVLRYAPGWAPVSVADAAPAPRPDALAPPLPAAQIAADRARPEQPPEPAPRLAASALGGDDAHGPGGHERQVALARGLLVHTLVERLAETPPEDRPARAAAILRSDGQGVPEDLRSGCAGEALRALALPELAPFLGPDSLAEAGLSAQLPGLGRLVGRIDRLAVTADRILLLDWKTGRPPAEDAPMPEPYLRQLAAYGLALEELLPGRALEAHVLWTEAPRLDRADSAALAAALDRLRAERGA